MNYKKQNKEEKMNNFLSGDKQENEEEKNQKPKCSCGSKLGVVSAIILTAVLVGGGVYYLMNQQHRSEKGKLMMQLESEKKTTEECEMEKEELKKEVTELNSKKEIQTIESINTNNWKICRSEKYGYEFKYPENWNIRVPVNTIISDCNNPQTPEVLYLGSTSPEETLQRVVFSTSKDSFTLDEFISAMEPSFVFEKKTSINNVEVAIYKKVGGPRGDIKFMKTFNNGFNFTFSAEQLPSDALFEAFVSSFKLIK